MKWKKLFVSSTIAKEQKTVDFHFQHHCFKILFVLGWRTGLHGLSWHCLRVLPTMGGKLELFFVVSRYWKLGLRRVLKHFTRSYRLRHFVILFLHKFIKKYIFSLKNVVVFSLKNIVHWFISINLKLSFEWLVQYEL